MEMIMARQEGLGSVFYTSAIVVYCVKKKTSFSVINHALNYL